MTVTKQDRHRPLDASSALCACFSHHPTYLGLKVLDEYLHALSLLAQAHDLGLLGDDFAVEQLLASCSGLKVCPSDTKPHVDE